MRAGSRRARVNALAKINLSLKVLHRRPDGFHELRTVFQTVSLADSIEIELAPAPRTSISVACKVSVQGENLVERAAKLAMKAAGATGEVKLRLNKAIPIGAGLGGGSSDAAAVLLTVPVLAGADLGMRRLIEIGSELGSDVPFFLLGGTAVAVGRGTELYPLEDAPGRHCLIVATGVHVSTAEAYRRLRRPELTSAGARNSISNFESLVWQLSSASPETLLAAENDFEGVVFRDHPQLGRIKRHLARAGASAALMTGSGSAVYGLFATRAEAARAGRTLPGQVFPVTLVSRARYRSMWWRRLGPHISGRIWPPKSRYA